MAMMVVGLIAKTMEYCQAQRDFELGGFHEHNPLLRPMLGHPTAMYAYSAACAMGAAWAGTKCARHVLASCASSVVASSLPY